ncbi:hypothetical protein M513_08928 [Trichuris suis]|uniref:Uncharacterized protein n=1 Tax=Trichuris suis TaxID=68888 RepID=A0A085LYY7_9BILA|nr:hypothetical protein M513_08928 [Trichuris suis]
MPNAIVLPFSAPAYRSDFDKKRPEWEKPKRAIEAEQQARNIGAEWQRRKHLCAASKEASESLPSVVSSQCLLLVMAKAALAFWDGDLLSSQKKKENPIKAKRHANRLWLMKFLTTVAASAVTTRPTEFIWFNKFPREKSAGRNNNGSTWPLSETVGPNWLRRSRLKDDVPNLAVVKRR